MSTGITFEWIESIFSSKIESVVEGLESFERVVNGSRIELITSP